jgi:hypothetical protein
MIIAAGLIGVLDLGKSKVSIIFHIARLKWFARVLEGRSAIPEGETRLLQLA